MLNLIFWVALLVSIPLRGVNPLYVTAALAGVGIMVVVALLVVGLLHGQGRAERFLRWLGGKLRFDPDTAANALRQIGERLEELIADRALLRAGAAVGHPQLAARRGVAVGVPARRSAARSRSTRLLVAFGLANIVAVIPITPGGLGIVEGVYIPTLVGFGLTRRAATLGVASYRLAQYWFPILLGGVLYASLRVGPWSIARRDRLDRLRDIAQRETAESERRMEFAMRQWERKQPGADATTRRSPTRSSTTIDAGRARGARPAGRRTSDDDGARRRRRPAAIAEPVDGRGRDQRGRSVSVRGP